MKKKVIIIISIVFAFAAACVTFAAILFESFVDSNPNVETGQIDGNTNLSTSTPSLSFTEAGQQKNLELTLSNNSTEYMMYQYNIAYKTVSSDIESLSSAIFVYYNGAFVDTLSNLCSNPNYDLKGENAITAFVNKESSATDTFTFELHSATDEALFKDKRLDLRITAEASSLEHENYIAVSTAHEFQYAIDDINSGILNVTPTIVLMGDFTVTEAITIKNPFNLDLNGNKLILNSNITLESSGVTTLYSSKVVSYTSNVCSGKIILNHKDLILDIKDFDGTTGGLTVNAGRIYADMITLRSYHAAGAKEIVQQKARLSLEKGMMSNSSNPVVGALSFYNVISYQNKEGFYIYSAIQDTLTVSNIDATVFTDLVVGGQTIVFKLIGDDTYQDQTILQSILNVELRHLVLASTPVNGVLVGVSSDLFLPTSIRTKNATIIWRSSNQSILSDSGKVSSSLENEATITVYADIKINDQVYVQSFVIKLISQNNETRFSYLVAEISPITLESIYTGSNADYAFFYLPIVNSNSQYDYRKEYTTPTTNNTDVSHTTWKPYKNIGLEAIHYSQINTYSYISVDTNSHNGVVDSSAVYLNMPSFSSFAQIAIEGKFTGDDKVYTGYINIIIELGFDTGLNELVFNQVDNELSKVDILQNILETRKTSGMLNEKGDFELPSEYMTYTITYGIPESSKEAISSISAYQDAALKYTITFDKIYDADGKVTTSMDLSSVNRYVIHVNPEGFSTDTTDYGITTIIGLPIGNTLVPEFSASRILYFSCPGVLLPDASGFSNISVFNSVKYQVVQNILASDDPYKNASNTGFTVSGTTITNKTGAYLLQRDIVYCESLGFNLDETNTTTSNHEVYGLSRVIEWAVSKTTSNFLTTATYLTASEKSSMTTYFGYINNQTSLGNVSSNGEGFISDVEANVIKCYYVIVILNDTSRASEFDALWSEIATKDTKYTLINGVELGTTVNTLLGNATDYFKYVEVFQWAHNDKDFPPETNGFVGNPPNFGVIGTRDWSGIFDDNWDINPSSLWSYKAVSGNWTNSKYAKNSDIYKEDATSYFTGAELEILFVYLLNKNVNKTRVYELMNYFIKAIHFSTAGMNTLITRAYGVLEARRGNQYSISSGNFTTEISSMQVPGLFTSISVPHVTALDHSLVGLSYFTNLKVLYVKGDSTESASSLGTLSAFHSTLALSTFFNSLVSNNTKLENLALVYNAIDYVDFDISTISKLKQTIKTIDLSLNSTIKSIAPLLSLTMSQLTYIDVCGVDIEYEFLEFYLQALYGKSSIDHRAEVYYFNISREKTQFETALAEAADGLIYIEDFDDLTSANLQVLQQVTNGNTNSEVYWKIESGNQLFYVDGSNIELPTLDTYISEYYYCPTSFGPLEGNCIYKVVKNGDYAYSKVVTDVIKLDSNEVPEALPDEEITKELATTDVIDKETSDETTVQSTWSGFPTASNSGCTSLYNSSYSSNTLTITDLNDETTTISGVYYMGYSTNTTPLSRTLVTTRTQTSYTNYKQNDTVQRNYLLANGNLFKAIYSVVSYIENTLITTTTKTSNCKNFVYSTTRGWTKTYKNILEEYPNAKSFSIDNQSILVSEGESNVETNNVEKPYLGPVLESSRIGNTQYISNVGEVTMDTTSSILSQFTWLENNPYFQYTGPTIATVFKEGTNVSLGLTNGRYVSTSFNTTSGITYTVLDSTDYLALEMYSNLRKANASIGTPKMGLYYGMYYAYGGATKTMQGTTYHTLSIYRLLLDATNQFYYEFYSTFTEISEGVTALNAITQTATSADVGKIYYYTGAADSSMTFGTNIFFELTFNTVSGLYYMKKFGSIGIDYEKYNSSNGTLNHSSNSLNLNSLSSLVNLRLYMDTGSNTSTYKSGTGGTDEVVVSVSVIVHSVEYIRKFKISVVG